MHIILCMSSLLVSEQVALYQRAPFFYHQKVVKATFLYGLTLISSVKHTLRFPTRKVPGCGDSLCSKAKFFHCCFCLLVSCLEGSLVAGYKALSAFFLPHFPGIIQHTYLYFIFPLRTISLLTWSKTWVGIFSISAEASAYSSNIIAENVTEIH